MLPQQVYIVRLTYISIPVCIFEKCKHLYSSTCINCHIVHKTHAQGPADEDETNTRRACVDVAKSHMGIPDASAFDFSACHRLSRKENAGIIVRFKDLQQRNEWLANAKSLKSHTDKVSIAADLPPVLRPLKKELLQKRKDHPAEQKRGSIVRNLKQWPYVELKILNGPVIKPSARAADIVNTVLGFNALWRLS